MATVSLLSGLKAALIDELQALSIATADGRSGEVQVSYSRPVADRVSPESIYFTSDASTVSEERRLSGARRSRQYTWELELVVECAALSDSEDAEVRCFAIAAAVETWLASNPQPAEWPNSSLDSGALWLVISGMRTDAEETDTGRRLSRVVLELEYKETLD